MRFTGTSCVVCDKYVMRLDDAKYFQVKGNQVIFIVCKEQPWSGIRTICHDCVNIIGASIEARPLERWEVEGFPSKEDWLDWWSDQSR